MEKVDKLNRYEGIPASLDFINVEWDGYQIREKKNFSLVEKPFLTLFPSLDGSGEKCVVRSTFFPLKDKIETFREKWKSTGIGGNLYLKILSHLKALIVDKVMKGECWRERIFLKIEIIVGKSKQNVFTEKVLCCCSQNDSLVLVIFFMATLHINKYVKERNKIYAVHSYDVWMGLWIVDTKIISLVSSKYFLRSCPVTFQYHVRINWGLCWKNVKLTFYRIVFINK